MYRVGSWAKRERRRLLYCTITTVRQDQHDARIIRLAAEKTCQSEAHRRRYPLLVSRQGAWNFWKPSRDCAAAAKAAQPPFGWFSPDCTGQSAESGHARRPWAISRAGQDRAFSDPEQSTWSRGRRKEVGCMERELVLFKFSPSDAGLCFIVSGTTSVSWNVKTCSEAANHSCGAFHTQCSRHEDHGFCESQWLRTDGEC